MHKKKILLPIAVILCLTTSNLTLANTNNYKTDNEIEVILPNVSNVDIYKTYFSEDAVFSEDIYVESEKYVNNEILQDIVDYVDSFYDVTDKERLKIIEDIYIDSIEKYAYLVAENKGVLPFGKQREDSSELVGEINEAYERMMIEEEYVVSLINELSEEQNATLDTWEANFDFLVENYEEIKNILDVNINHVDSYILGYTYVPRTSQVKNDVNTINNKKITYENFNRDMARSYALAWYNSYNPSYPNWDSRGGDCANFVSQALKNGGKSPIGSPPNVEPVTNWFSSGTSAIDNNVSQSWRHADVFRNHWLNRAVDSEMWASWDMSAFAYGFKGDPVSLINTRGKAYHTLIIIDYYGASLICAQHSGGYRDVDLKNRYDFRIYKMD